MTPRTTMRLAGAVGALGVACGAFGAHALAPTLEQLGTEDTFATASRYHLLHALALGLAACARAHVAATWCFFGGTAVFSGTVYAIALGGPKWLGAITPIGGALMIAGWVVLGLSGCRDRASATPS